MNNTLWLTGLITLLLSAQLPARTLPLQTLHLPQGYQIRIVAEVDNARQMARVETLNGQGILFVGSRRAGKVVALRDRDGDGYYEQQYLIAKGLDLPSGVAVKGNDLYVAAVDKVWRYPDLVTRLENPPAAQLVTDQLPDETHHGWKYLKFGPDGGLYLNVGAPCNICLSHDPRFAAIIRLNTETGKQQVIASGVRNSVGFTWHPQDKSLWFTDNGRDHLGDDQPDDELNRSTEIGQHFGYPYVHAKGIRDPRFGHQGSGTYVAPMLELGAHVAPLGLTFYTGDQLPDATQNTLFIAEHGSWNRSLKVGYRVVRVETQAGKVISHTSFISGWLRGQRHWGRPADVLVDHDGSLLISDDYAGVIYRVTSAKKPTKTTR